MTVLHTADAVETVELPMRHHRRRRMTVWAAATCAGILLMGGAGMAIAATLPRDDASSSREVSVNRAKIERGTLAGSTIATGTLAFAGARSIGAGVSGIVTSLPLAGGEVRSGEIVYAVDNVPVFLFTGSLPAWRPFGSGMDDGPDVLALEQNLQTLGHFDREPDSEFTWATREAVYRWQKATGQARTGSIDLGRILFAPGAIRVSEVAVGVGDSVGPGATVLKVTELEKHVNVDLKLSDQDLAVVGAEVTIDLPAGVQTTGAVSAVGVPTEKDGSGGSKSVVIPVTIALHDAAATGALQQATVSVNFPTEQAEDVLSVPVGALLALDETTFGVEVIEKTGVTRQVPVKTGLFAGGRVEISGKGISEGQEVVVPSL